MTSQADYIKRPPEVAWLCVPLILAAGCGGGIERFPVSGQVLIDGEPLSYGVIRVFPKGARPAGAKLDEEGRFSLVTSGIGEGVPVGSHAVEVDGGEIIDAQTIRWHAPGKYQSRKQSGLSIEVSAATDDCVVNLTWGDGKPFVKKYN